MRVDQVLLVTDAVDSTRLTEELGDERASRLWADHDRVARQLVRHWRGTEIDKSDGFLLLFDSVDDAVGCALSLHQALARLDPPILTRAGIHRALMVLRKATSAEHALGARPMELDGVGKSVAARIMALACGGQTLLSEPAREELQLCDMQLQSHGYWRLKGVADPLELFEVAAGSGGALHGPPPDAPKAYRVVFADGGWTPAAELHHGLPAERDRFVGRADMLAALAARFDDGARLVTVLGIGGMGKTRLALRYARQWLGDYPGGAWFCDLSSARGLDGIVHAVAQGLDVPLGKADPVQQLGTAINGRGECLVILDNFEQVARHAEATVGQWLAHAPRARLLVTSREVLGTRGEEALVLAPLGVEEAVQLFDRRARATDGCGVTAEVERQVLPRLVELLDCLPLAIELAAARVSVMSPREMLKRMNERFKLLVARGGRRDRQATMRGALDWSWELLSRVERSVLAQMSVFEGGFTLEALEAVVALPAGADSVWVADPVQALVEKSLVRNEGSRRFGLLRTVQEYAGEKLEADAQGEDDAEPPRDAVQRRHWRHFAGTDESKATLDRCADIGNLYMACQRAVAQEPALAVNALQATWHALRRTGPFRAALDLVDAVESAASLGPAQRAIVDRVAGAAMYLLGDIAGASRRYASSLEQADRAGHRLARAEVLCMMADLEMARGQLAVAQAQLDEALAAGNDCGHAATRLRAVIGLGALDLRRSRLDSAREHFQQGMALAQHIGDRRRLGGLQGNLGLVEQLRGHPEKARDNYAASLTLANDVGDRQWEGNARCNLGMLLHELGEQDAARDELQAALFVARSIGHRRLEATTLCNLGLVADATAKAEEALQLLQEAVAVARTLGDRSLLGQFLGYLGLAMAGRSQALASEHFFDEGLEALSGIDDAAALGMLLCQRAIAAAQRGDERTRQRWHAAATALLAASLPDAGSELARALERANQTVG